MGTRSAQQRRVEATMKTKRTKSEAARRNQDVKYHVAWARSLSERLIALAKDRDGHALEIWESLSVAISKAEDAAHGAKKAAEADAWLRRQLATLNTAERS
jgi:hypothetical protein